MKKHKKMSMQLFFVLFVVVELLVITVVTSLLVDVLGTYVPVIRKIPDSVWLLFACLVLGGAVNFLLARFFFDPVVKLRSAMGRITRGDFSVRLDSTHMFPEIRQINQDFNTMTKELGSTEILKTEFISNVSHEFKTPINAIEGYATLLQGEEDPQQQEVYVQKILFNTQRLSRLVGNILLLSKVDNQGIQTHVSTYRLDEQIRQCLLALEPRWSKAENEFEVNLQSIEYTGNESLLIHVWNNLLENAIKYGPQGGLITMNLTEQEGIITFSIQDQGPGISEEAQQHVFDRFYQGDTSRKTEGNGLGLALVKHILAISDGKIHVESEPGKGSRFVVELVNHKRKS